MSIPHGYKRQMAAKLLAAELTSDTHLVITDDDTESLAPWGEGTFFDEQGRARIFYRRADGHFWRAGNARLFGVDCPRDWQLRLPFAIHRETLQGLFEAHGAQVLELWERDVWVSEFAAMGEWAWRTCCPFAVCADVQHDLTHWAIGRRPAFRDWQANRRSYRRAINARLTP
jgi:hypothetical protein